MKTDLERGFDDLLGQNNRQRGGYQFQRWLRDLLVRDGFEVHSSPPMAKPRQTDIHACQGGRDFLIEAKWRASKKVDVADIDALRSRLDRTPGDVVGCLFSLSDYSRTAINAVENRRDREILLFNATEIRNLAGSSGILLKMIEDKRTNLRVHARVEFVNADAPSARPVETRLPDSSLVLSCGRRLTDYVPSRTDNIDIVFTQDHLDPIGSSDDPEFALTLDLNVGAFLNSRNHRRPP